MGLLNGLNGLASGVGAVAATGLKEAAQQEADKDDAATRASLMNRTPAPDVVAPVAAPTTALTAPASPDAGSDGKQTVVPTPSGGVIAGVPADLLPIYQRASKQSGIPVALLIAQGKQESGFRNDAVSPTGAIGVAQILPSTARDPGYGLAPIDPAKLTDPSVAIPFQAAYMRARAGGAGADFSNPATVDTALKAYNGNSDPHYVSRIRGFMGSA